MVLSGLGLDISEAELRELCDCTYFGTDPLQVVDAARQLGFAKTTKQTLSVSELETIIAKDCYPIVHVSLRPIDGRRGTHALVIIELTDDNVTVYDPEQGERLLARHIFTAAWDMQHNLTIIVE